MKNIGKNIRKKNCKKIYVVNIPKNFLILQNFFGFQDVFGVISFRLPRRPEDVLQIHLEDVLKTSQKTKNYYVEGVLKTS